MKDSNSTYSDPVQKTNKFNNFFTSIGPSLANNIPPFHVPYEQFLIGSYASSFFLSPTSTSEVSSVIFSLKKSKSEGHDGLQISPIKESIDLLEFPLSHVYNLSLSTGVFPDDTSNFSNCRPILPCLYKVLEKLFYSRLWISLQI